MDGIKDKIVVITGASSGIGEAAAVMLAERRAKVVLGARFGELTQDVVHVLAVTAFPIYLVSYQFSSIHSHFYIRDANPNKSAPTRLARYGKLA